MYNKTISVINRKTENVNNNKTSCQSIIYIAENYILEIRIEKNIINFLNNAFITL